MQRKRYKPEEIAPKFRQVAGMPVPGPRQPTWALPQIGSYLGYSECGASLSGRAEPVTQRGHPQI